MYQVMFVLLSYICLLATPQDVYDALEMLGFSHFRPGQETAVMRVLCGEISCCM